MRTQENKALERPKWKASKGLLSDDNMLGKPLPLYDSEGLDPAQKGLFNWLMDVAVPWANDAGFQACTEAGPLIGPFNPAVPAPAISSAFIELAVAEQKTHR